METLIPEIKNYYSCQNCGSLFYLEEPVKIIEMLQPVCSKRCEFGLIYKFIEKMEYSDEILEIFQKIVEKKDKIEYFSRQKAIYSLSKSYEKVGLSNIKVVWTLDKDKNDWTNNLTEGTLDMISPPIVIGGMSNDLSHPFRKRKKSLSHHSNGNGGVFKQWF